MRDSCLIKQTCFPRLFFITKRMKYIYVYMHTYLGRYGGMLSFLVKNKNKSLPPDHAALQVLVNCVCVCLYVGKVANLVPRTQCVADFVSLDDLSISGYNVNNH